MSSANTNVQKKRLIRLTIAHYRNENCSEEEMYNWGTGKHAVHVANIHAKHGMEGYAVVSHLLDKSSSIRQDLCADIEWLHAALESILIS